MKIYLIVILLIIANFQWVFILSNLERIKTLKSISLKNVNNLGVNEYKDELFNNGFLHTNNIVIKDREQLKINPIEVNIPLIDIEAPIFTTNTNYDEFLDLGVVNMDIDREGIYLFGHSSAINTSPYQYIFTRITQIGIGDSVFIEDKDGNIYEYKYTKSFYKNPNRLEELEDREDVLYLITCYPFGSTLTRYVVELKQYNILTK